jgi:hypothetical protein
MDRFGPRQVDGRSQPKTRRRIYEHGQGFAGERRRNQADENDCPNHEGDHIRLSRRPKKTQANIALEWFPNFKNSPSPS